MKFETIYVDSNGEIHESMPEGWAVRENKRSKYYDKNEHTLVQQTIKVIEKMAYIQQTLF